MDAVCRRTLFLPNLILSIIFVLGLTSCRTRPKLDLGYQPNFSDAAEPLQENYQHDFDTDEEIEESPDQETYAFVDDSSDWEYFTGVPIPTPSEIEIEKIDDRRWTPIYFAYNRSFIGESERQKLELLADYLIRNTEFIVIVEGHCDARGSEEFNRSLGQKRAFATRDYLSKLGVDGSRIRTLSYGEERLVDPGESEAAHARNRRAEFIIGLPK